MTWPSVSDWQPPEPDSNELIGVQPDICNDVMRAIEKLTEEDKQYLLRWLQSELKDGEP